MPSFFGGHRGGRKTKSGYPVGSAEHAAWSREQDKQRKAAGRMQAAAAVAPPPLPPLAAVVDQTRPGMVDAPAASPVHLGSLPGSEVSPPIHWLAKDIEPLALELVHLTEEMAVSQVTKKCRGAKLPPEVIREIESDIAWADRSKKMLADGLAEISVGQLNENQVPLAVRPYIKVGMAGLQIGVGHMKILNRLDKLIAAAKNPSLTTPPKP